MTGDEWNLVKDVDVKVRRAEAEEAMRAVVKKDARLDDVLGKNGERG